MPIDTEISAQLLVVIIVCHPSSVTFLSVAPSSALILCDTRLRTVFYLRRRRPRFFIVTLGYQTF